MCDRIVAVEFMMISALLYINLSLPAFASLTAMSPMSWLMFCRVDFRNNICMQTPPDICFSRIIPLNEQEFKGKGLYFNDFLAKCRALVLMRFLTSFETCLHQFWWKRLIISTNFGGRGVNFHEEK